VLFGAVLTAEDGRVSVGARSIVMENALIRGQAQHPAIIGDDVLVGPQSFRRPSTSTSGASGRLLGSCKVI
jgi:gamma-carbonic anhydrase